MPAQTPHPNPSDDPGDGSKWLPFGCLGEIGMQAASCVVLLLLAAFWRQFGPGGVTVAVVIGAVALVGLMVALVVHVLRGGDIS